MRYSYLGTDVDFPARLHNVADSSIFVRPGCWLVGGSFVHGQSHGRPLESLFVQLNVPLLL